MKVSWVSLSVFPTCNEILPFVVNAERLTAVNAFSYFSIAAIGILSDFMSDGFITDTTAPVSTKHFTSHDLPPFLKDM